MAAPSSRKRHQHQCKGLCQETKMAEYAMSGKKCGKLINAQVDHSSFSEMHQ